MGSGVWKYLAIVSFTFLCGVVTGTYNPNRNIATKDDLVPIIQEQQATTNSINDLKLQIAMQQAKDDERRRLGK